MARIISQVDPATGRRQKIAGIEGDYRERTAAISETLGVKPSKAIKLSNDKIARELSPGFASFDRLNTQSLTTTPDIKLPPTPVPVQAAGLNAELKTEGDQFLTRLGEEKAARQEALKSSGNDLMSFLQNDLQGKTALTDAAYQAEGVDELKGRKEQLSNQLAQEDIRLERQIARIQTAPGTATAAERDRQVSELERVSARKRADIAIELNTISGDYARAREIADRAVALATERQAQELDLRKFIYQENKELFTKSEQRQFETQLADRNRALEFEQFKLKSDYEQKIQQADPLYQAQLAKARQDLVPAAASPLAVAQSEQGVTEVSGLLSDDNLKTAVGPNPLARISLTDWFTGGKSNFIAGVEQLRSQLSLDSLINAKANGATFGALSEGELKLLQQSGSKLSTWAQKDKEGNVVGYKANEGDFKAELDKINNFKKLDYILKGGSPANVGVQVMADGTFWTRNSDGTLTQLR